MIYPRTKVYQRRREVTTLLVRGVTASEIAEILELPRQTVYNDIRVVRSGRNEALMAFAKYEMIAQMILNVLARWRFLWHLAETAKSEHAKVQAMRELRLNDQHIVQKLPFLYEEEELEKTKEEYHETIARLTEQVKGLARRRKWMEDHNIWPTVSEEDMQKLRDDDNVFDNM